jgi:putative hemolysin
LVAHSLGRIPKISDVIVVEGARIAVLSMEGKRAGNLLISRPPAIVEE